MFEEWFLNYRTKIARGQACEIHRDMKAAYQAGQKAERERCATVCIVTRHEDGDGQHTQWYAGIDECIEAIRDLDD